MIEFDICRAKLKGKMEYTKLLPIFFNKKKSSFSLFLLLLLFFNKLFLVITSSG